jgi:hypothetical protein
VLWWSKLLSVLFIRLPIGLCCYGRWFVDLPLSMLLAGHISFCAGQRGTVVCDITHSQKGTPYINRAHPAHNTERLLCDLCTSIPYAV